MKQENEKEKRDKRCTQILYGILIIVIFIFLFRNTKMGNKIIKNMKGGGEYKIKPEYCVYVFAIMVALWMIVRFVTEAEFDSKTTWAFVIVTIVMCGVILLWSLLEQK